MSNLKKSTAIFIIFICNVVTLFLLGIPIVTGIGPIFFLGFLGAYIGGFMPDLFQKHLGKISIFFNLQAWMMFLMAITTETICSYPPSYPEECLHRSLLDERKEICNFQCPKTEFEKLFEIFLDSGGFELLFGSFIFISIVTAVISIVKKSERLLGIFSIVALLPILGFLCFILTKWTSSL